MDTKHIRIINIKRLKEEAGISDAELARRVDTNPSYLSQMLSESKPVEQRVKHVGHKIARRIEAAFNKPAGWLDQLPVKVIKNDDIIAKYPLLKLEDAPEWRKNPSLNSSHMTIPLAIPDENQRIDANSFYTEILGTAMIDKFNYSKSIGDGDLALVDMTKTPKPGDLVVVEIAPKDVRIREYQEDGANKMLYAYNDDIKPIILTDNMKIIGCVVYSVRKRAKE